MSTLSRPADEEFRRCGGVRDRENLDRALVCNSAIEILDFAVEHERITSWVRPNRLSGSPERIVLQSWTILSWVVGFEGLEQSISTVIHTPATLGMPGEAVGSCVAEGESASCPQQTRANVGTSPSTDL